MATCRNGLLGWLWSLIGSTTPAYFGTGQPAPGRGWCGWFSTTPAYQPAPSEPPPMDDGKDQPDQGAGNGTSDGTVRIVIRRE